MNTIPTPSDVFDQLKTLPEGSRLTYLKSIGVVVSSLGEENAQCFYEQLFTLQRLDIQNFLENRMASLLYIINALPLPERLKNLLVRAFKEHHQKSVNCMMSLLADLEKALDQCAQLETELQFYKNSAK